jgi:hypothetical protein
MNMDEVDKRNVLDNEVFTYRVGKDDKVFISWHGKQVKILKGEEARKLIGKMVELDHKAAQLVLAKITGNFKRGNERQD